MAAWARMCVCTYVRTWRSGKTHRLARKWSCKTHRLTIIETTQNTITYVRSMASRTDSRGCNLGRHADSLTIRYITNAKTLTYVLRHTTRMYRLKRKVVWQDAQTQENVATPFVLGAREGGSARGHTGSRPTAISGRVTAIPGSGTSRRWWQAAAHAGTALQAGGVSGAAAQARLKTTFMCSRKSSTMLRQGKLLLRPCRACLYVCTYLRS